jgi:hypothetical protein
MVTRTKPLLFLFFEYDDTKVEWCHPKVKESIVERIGG